MGLETAIKAIVDYFQNLSIIAGLKISWPPALEPFIAWLYFIRLDFVTKLNVDFRGQYLSLVNILPLVLAILLLAFFQPVMIIVWYIFLLASIGAIIIGTILLLGTQTPFSVQKQIGYFLLFSGIAVLVICIVAYGVNQYLKKRRRNKRKAMIGPETNRVQENVLLTASLEPGTTTYVSPLSPMMPNNNHYSSLKAKQTAFPSNMSLDDEPSVKTVHKKRTFKRPAAWKLCLRAFFGLFIAYLGICFFKTIVSGNILIILMSSSQFDAIFNSDSSSGVGSILGGIFFPLGMTLVMSVVLNLFLRGRRFLHNLKAFFIWNMGTIIFLFLSLAYIPITTSLFNVFACSWETCSAGQEFNFKSVTLDVDSILSNFNAGGYNRSVACRSCNFMPECPANLSSQLCPGSTALRLNVDKSISCTSEIYPYYAPGAFLLFFVLVVGLPYVYIKLTGIATKLLLEIPPDVAPPNSNENQSVTEDQIWRAQMTISNNICRGLYIAYRYKWRYFGVIIMGQKLSVVLISTFKAYYSTYALYFLSANYLAFMFLIIVGRPHIVPFENVLYSLFFFSSALNSSIGILSIRGIDIPSAAQYVIAIGSLALPITIVIFELAIDMRMQKRLIRYLKTEKGRDESLGELNAHAVQTIVRFFLAVGVASFLALCLAAVSIIKVSASGNVLPTIVPPIAQGETAVRSFEFAGYNNWTQFTQNCCCEVTTRTNGSLTWSELWKCLPTSNFSSNEFTYKIKKRQDASKSGLSLRPYCGLVFNTSHVCGEPTYNSTLNRFTVTPCSSDADPAVYADYW